MPILDYKDFEVAIIGDGKKSSWYTWAKYDNASAIGKFNLKKNKIWLEGMMNKLDQDLADGHELRIFGEHLYKSLFTDDVGALFHRAKSNLPPNTGLRIEINTNNPIVNRLPWEFLFHTPRFLAIYTETPVMRKLPTLELNLTTKKIKKLRILIVISNPSDHATLNVQQEIGYIKSEFKDLIRRGRVELNILPQVTLEKLETALRSQYDIFHFIGHAGLDQSSQKGMIVLEDKKQYSKDYDGEVLAAVLKNSGIRLAILNACDTAKPSENQYMLGVAHSLLQGGIPMVIGMQFEIPDQTAIGFTKRFYSEIINGESVSAALTKTRQSISGDTGMDKKDWGIPVLYTVDPQNLIFEAGSNVRQKTQSSNLRQKKLSLRTLSKSTNVIGICDINSLLIDLDSIVMELNSLQKYFHFKVIPGFYSVEMFTKYQSRKYLDADKTAQELKPLFKKYKDIKLKTIIGITQNLIKDDEYSDLFTTAYPDLRISVISTYHLAEFAKKANRRLEHAVMYLILGELAAIYEKKIDYHDKTNVCLMDFCSNRGDIIKGLREPRLDNSCKNKISDRHLREALLKLLDYISKNKTEV